MKIKVGSTLVFLYLAEQGELIMDLRQFNNGLPIQIDIGEAEKQTVSDRLFLTTDELAKRWRISKRTIENQRYKKNGIPFYKLDGSVRYDLNDVIAYELKNFYISMSSK